MMPINHFAVLECTHGLCLGRGRLTRILAGKPADLKSRQDAGAPRTLIERISMIEYIKYALP